MNRFSKPIYTVVLLIVALVLPAAAQAQETVDCEAGFKQVAHAMGTACVTENPQRVVVLEWTYAEDVLALGLQPIGVADIEGYNNWVKIPVALDESAADVGFRNEPNLERIAELNPDLIIAVSFRVINNYDELSAIAPTLVFDPYPADGSSHYDEMTSTLTSIAAALNREAEAQQVLERMETYFANANAALESAGRTGETFILSQGFMVSEVPTFRLFTDNAMAVEVLSRIGLENAWDDAPQLYGFTEVSIEAFSQLGDTNFFYVAQNDHNTFLSESPLWSRLPFVESQRAYWLGGDAWLFGGPLSAEVLVDSVLQSMNIVLPEVTPEATPEVSS